MEQTNINQNWLEQEAKELNTKYNGEKVPALKFEENREVIFKVDFSKPFEKWEAVEKDGSKTTKKIIPVEHAGQKKVLWLNVRNPLYSDIINAGKEGRNTFRVLQTGKQDKTRYILIEEN